MTLFTTNTSTSYKLISDKLIKRYVRLVLWLYEVPLKEPYNLLLDRIFKLRDHTGWPKTVEYLKHCTVSVQHVVSGRGKVLIEDKGCRVGLKNSGLPLLVPGLIRDKILINDLQAIRVTLAILTVFRCIPIKKNNLKLKTIIGPFTGLSKTLQKERMLYVLDSLLFPKDDKGVRKNLPRRPKGLDMLLPLRTAGPNGKPSILMAPFDAFAFKALKQNHLVHAIQVLSQSFGADIHRLLQIEMDAVSGWMVSKVPILSKLSFKVEPAGKVRVFAILDVWSQSALEPIHKHIFDILKGIPNDGCFDQTRPLKRLMSKGLKDIYSFDLSAATDRLPIDVQMQVMSWLYGYDVANAWKTLMVDRDYYISEKSLYTTTLINKKETTINAYGDTIVSGDRRINPKYNCDFILDEDSKVGDSYRLRYAVGQPMGALSSWGVFSLTHHVIIQYCAAQAGFKTWFDDYALLGDDVVIAHKEVADIYRYTMVEILGVDINMSKSLISNNGTAEFAKQLVSGDINYSPVGAKNIAQSLKSFANFPSLLRDYISKGGIVDNAGLQRLIGSLGYQITKVSHKNLTSLLWVIMGPFGFINTGENRLKPELFAQSGVALSPYDMRLRMLSYALDWLIVPIKETLREDYRKDWLTSLEKSSKVLDRYLRQSTVKGFVVNDLSKALGYAGLTPKDVNPDIRVLPSYRNLLYISMKELEDLVSRDELEINWPYSLPFVEGLRYVLNNIKWPIPSDNLFNKPRVERPRFRQTNKDFFMKVRGHLIKLVEEHESSNAQSFF